MIQQTQTNNKDAIADTLSKLTNSITQQEVFSECDRLERKRERPREEDSDGGGFDQDITDDGYGKP